MSRDGCGGCRVNVFRREVAAMVVSRRARVRRFDGVEVVQVAVPDALRAGLWRAGAFARPGWLDLAWVFGRAGFGCPTSDMHSWRKAGRSDPAA